MEKILVSACLLGEKTRYDGKSKSDPNLIELNRYYDLVPFCPEVEGGLEVPRLPSEIRNGNVYNKKGANVTKEFRLGAEKALKLCRLLNIQLAVLKEGSPSCGPHHVHDGSFTDRMVNGLGVTAALLQKNGIRVISEEEVPALLEGLKANEAVKDQKTAEAKELEKSFAAGKKPYAGKPGSERKPAEEGEGAKPEEGASEPSSIDKKPYGKKPYGDHKGYSHHDNGHGGDYHHSYGHGNGHSYGHSGDGHGHSYGKPHSSYGHSSYGDKPHYQDGEKPQDGEHSSTPRKPYSGDHKGGYSHGKSYGHSSYGKKPYFGKGGKKPYSKFGKGGYSQGKPSHSSSEGKPNRDEKKGE